MKKLKRFLVALLSCVTAMACVVGFASCVSNETDSDPVTSSSSSNAEDSSSGPVDPATCEHSGGTATCKAQAICEKCHTAYGELGYHSWNEVGKCVHCDKNAYQWNADCGDYYITDANSLILLADIVNKGNPMDGIMVKLTADIDLNNTPFESIGREGKEGTDDIDRWFAGAFDGQSHTIKNLNINKPDQYGVGLFGLLAYSEQSISNLTIENATVVGKHHVGVIVGGIYGPNDVQVEISNCHVKNATVKCEDSATEPEDGDKAGAIVGFIAVGKVSDCTAENVTITANRDAGQLVGGAYTSVTVEGCTATAVTVSHNGFGSGANIKNELVGRLA